MTEETRETLGHMVGALLDNINDTDQPEDVARTLLGQLGDEQLREVAYRLLIDYVKDRMRHDTAAQVSYAVPRRSSKVQSITNWYQRTLAARVNVDGTWKPLGSCSTADVKLLAQERWEAVAKTTAHAQRYERLAKALDEHRVATVAELPADVLAGVLK